MAKKKPPSSLVGRRALQQMSEMWDWYQSHRRSEHPGSAEPFTKFGPRIMRFAKTMANTICASYPTSTAANTFPVRLGSVDYVNTSCGTKTLTFTAYDPVEDRVVHSYKNKYIAAGTIVIIYLAHDKWYVEECPSQSLTMVKATSCVYPGGSGSGILMDYDTATGAWVDTATAIVINDPGAWNCLLIGETVFALQNDDGEYDIIGSHGLLRKGVVATDIVCGQSGSVVLFSDRTDNSCSATGSACTVTACNTWGEVRKILGFEEVTVAYMGTFPISGGSQRRWVIIPNYFPHWVVGTLTEDMCPEHISASVESISGTYADGCPSVAVTTGRNDFKLSGYSGSKVLLLRRDDLQGIQWTIVQVQHQAGYFLFQFDMYKDNCTIVAEWEYERIAYMGCGQFDDDSAQIGFTNKSVVTGSRSTDSGGTCKLELKLENICTLVPNGSQTSYVDLITFSAVPALEDVYLDGLCVRGQMGVHYVACFGTSMDVELFCGNPCDSGSGSQSGQSGGQQSGSGGQ